MEYMKAAVLTAFGSAEVFEFQTIPKPVPKATQVLVRVYATSLNPLDYQTRRGDYKDLVRLPAIIGVDVSGVIEALQKPCLNLPAVQLDHSTTPTDIPCDSFSRNRH